MSTANGGIGFELAAQLVSDASKHVLLGSRSVEKGEAAVKSIRSQHPQGHIDLVQIDVANDESISTAAQNVQSKYGRYVTTPFARHFNYE